ncbi:mRNA-capping enzyme-like [Syngnathus scovelli]|uniref:mRNA-capping enzyme-like n=1 Tax=Syngnathus scovelli TaxID=161590 RepID=UPI0021104BB0|nr:mRNA-capping enzyme-like [Syngnathus scovelli]XP_049614033.1 mRNA-capping enzyme-like [Syngnathus scovelli]
MSGMLPPHGWAKCPAQGFTICGFITPGKTFLDGRYDKHIPSANHYKAPKPYTYGAVIDLTNTTRYYNGKALGACYHKICCKGHNQCPSPRAVRTFLNLCQAAQGPVYVHCTYGFNRTGYLVCCYLVERRKMSVHDAIRLFAEARPPGIYKEEYVKTLCIKYNARTLLVAAELPAWLPELPVTRAPARDETPKYKLGLGAVHDAELRAEITRVITGAVGYRYRDQFPGCMPVSMSRHNYSEVVRLGANGRATWKADGTRYMLYIDGRDRVYVMDRCATIWQLTEDRFERPDGLHLTDTLVDCEHCGQDLYIFDVIYVCGTHVADYTLDSRLEAVSAVARCYRGPLRVTVKAFVPLSEFEALYEAYAGRSDCDGFLFQSNEEPYYGGRDVSVVKYKPPEKNTVDFKLVPVDAQCAGLYLHGATEPFARVLAWDPAMAGCVVECAFADGAWRVLRVRSDKTQANTYFTALRVYDSICEPVDFGRFRDLICE